MSMSDCPKCWDTPCSCGHQNPWVPKVERLGSALCDMVGQYCSEGEAEDGATIIGEPMDQASAADIEALVGLGYLTPREVVGFQFTSKAGVWGPKA